MFIEQLELRIANTIKIGLLITREGTILKIYLNMEILIEIKYKVIDRHSLGGKNRCF